MQIKLTTRELATVLAALRYWQGELEDTGGEPPIDDYFVDQKPLMPDDIDELCERLNLAERNPNA
jgi:hypothetical protein